MLTSWYYELTTNALYYCYLNAIRLLNSIIYYWIYVACHYYIKDACMPTSVWPYLATDA